eukprot:GEMP01080953.1.p1 GENE.GEMP01080953.1~~GEMP01080953.1.p1  ORF type:complete len:152 (+),score=35.07 GEMP01080953.1:331-786(+)
MRDSKKRGAENYKKIHVGQQEVPTYTSHFDITKPLVVCKKRQKVPSRGKLKSEIAFVSADGRWWKSLCWEGSPENIYFEVQNHFRLKDEWVLSDIHLPPGGFVGGYPAWVAVVASGNLPEPPSVRAADATSAMSPWWLRVCHLARYSPCSS